MPWNIAFQIPDTLQAKNNRQQHLESHQIHGRLRRRCELIADMLKIIKSSLETGGKSSRKRANFSRIDLGIVRDFDSELTVTYVAAC